MSKKQKPWEARREEERQAALEHLRPLHINCACGARWTYLTNVQAEEWRVKCIRCQAVNVARMGRRGTAYIATPEKED